MVSIMQKVESNQQSEMSSDLPADYFLLATATEGSI